MMKNDARWSQAIGLVTGASSGIGVGVARSLASMGMRVAIGARRVERLHALVPELMALGAHDVYCVDLNVREEASIQSALDRIEGHWGEPVTVLVNNAGLGKAERLQDGQTAAWQEMLEVNVLGLSVATREVLQRMGLSRENGHIIHISSMSAYRVPPGSGMYAATKHAVKALTEGLRKELREARSPIRVTAISPGFVRTEFAEKFHGSADMVSEVYDQYPVITPDEIGATVRFVLEAPPHMEFHDLLVRPRDQDT